MSIRLRNATKAVARTPLLTICAVFLVVASMAARPKPPAVVVSAVGTSDGFTESDSKQRTDTAEDLKTALKHQGVPVVGDGPAREIHIRVTDRQIGPVENTGGTVIAPIGRNVVVVPTRQQTKTITATLKFRDISRQFNAWGNGSWSSLAGKMADDISTWLRDNQAKLR
jgi:hypothetical protein